MTAYNLSITTGTENGTCIITNDVNDQSEYFAEFLNYEDACDYLDNCFELIEYKDNYCVYIKKIKE